MNAPGQGAPLPIRRRREVGDVLLAVEDVSLRFGGVAALSNISFEIRKGEIRAISGGTLPPCE